MKNFILCLSAIAVSTTINAQWVGTNPLTTNSKVGIGTVLTPTAELQIPNGEALIGGADGLNLSGLNYTLAVRSKSILNSTYAFYVGDNSGHDLFWSKGDGDAYVRKNLGIGISPAAALHVNGTLKFDGIGAMNNFVLTSDASGNATWKDPLLSSLWQKKCDE